MLDVRFQMTGDNSKKSYILLKRLLEKNGYNIASLAVEVAPPRLYKYGMRCRPFGIGCQPEGYEKHEESDKEKSGYWSYVWYPEKLPKEEEFNYDLCFLE